MNYVLSKKTSWIILILLFIFDSTVSYIAVTRMNGKEANLAIAYFVEKYPVLYLLYIPPLILIIYLIVLGLTKLAKKLFGKLKIKEEILERIILTSTVIYWAVGNSFMNLSFILGYRLSIPTWYKLSAFGILLAVIYFFLLIFKNKK